MLKEARIEHLLSTGVTEAIMHGCIRCYHEGPTETQLPRKSLLSGMVESALLGIDLVARSLSGFRSLAGIGTLRVAGTSLANYLIL
jgi:hypothetical protein